MAFASLPLKNRLILTYLILTISALLLSLILIEGLSWQRYRSEALSQSEGLAEFLGNNVTAAMAFEQAEAAENILASLHSQAEVAEVMLVTRDGKVLATYLRDGGRPSLDPANFKGPSTIFDGRMLIQQSVQYRGEVIGNLYMGVTLDKLTSQLRRSISNTLVILGVCIIFAGFFSYILGNMLSRPILELSSTAEKIRMRGDFSIRAAACSAPELNELSGAFNRMLDKIQEGEQKLQRNLRVLSEEKENLKQAQQRERELVERLSRAKRMESVGILAGGVAHDLNNLLGPVLGYPELILKQLTENDPIRRDLEEVIKAASRSAAIIQDLLTLGRRGSYQLVPVNLNTIATSYIESRAYRERLQETPHIKQNLNFDEALEPILGSAPHLTQVVMNLILNALESMIDGGELTLTTQSYHAQRDEDILGGVLMAGAYSMLSVKDTGEGIDKDALEHIFEPFFTQKKLGRSGSGLGLSVVYGVTRDLKGFLDVHTRLGEGTEFRLFFPISPKGVPVDVVEEVPLGRNERVLIVDDVVGQRRLGVRILEDLGYRAVQAESGEAALDYILREHVDLVILDMIMPGGWDGLESYTQIQKVRPGLKCIFCSGYTDLESSTRAVALGVEQFLAKPYTLSELGDCVGKALRADAEEKNKAT